MTATRATGRIPAWTTWLGILIFAAIFLWLRHALAEFHWHDIVRGVRAIRGNLIALAIILTVAGYGFLTLYELLGLRYAQIRLPYRRIAATSFTAYAIGHSVGMNTLSGGAIRFRAYSAIGIRASHIATVVALGTVTFALGTAFLLGVSLLSDAGRSANVLHLGAAAEFAAAIVLLAGVASYVILAQIRTTPIPLGRFRLRMPSMQIAMGQVFVACGDILCAAGVLYVLLPSHQNLSFIQFAGIYVIGIAAGIITTVPAGIGVFESIMLLLLPQLPPARLLASLLVYRSIYYLLPLCFAALLLAWHELWLHRRALRRTLGLARVWVAAVTPQAAALAVFAAGAVLLFSSATPGLEERLAWLREFIPLGLLELSNLLSSAVGVALLVLANGLYRRLDAAWWVTVWLLAAGACASLLKGFDYEEALILAFVDSILILARARFHRRASLIDQRFSASWVAAVLVVLGVTVWLVLFAYRHVPYAHNVWWQFAFEASAPRSLRALLLAALMAGAYGLRRLLRPAPAEILAASGRDFADAEALIAKGDDTTANLALLGDKNLMFDPARTAFIMYSVSGSSWVTMGDPVGDPLARSELAWQFFEECDRAAASPVFYQVSAAHLSLYVDLGLSCIKMGEEARVSLADFSLQGSRRADLRQLHRRAEREGARFEVIARGELDAVLQELRAISDAWLEDKKAAEKGFSLGCFDESYLRHFDCALVRSGNRIVAFANLWQAGNGEELSVDLMRYREPAPKSVVDYLFIECMLWGKTRNFRWFNLGMAPLSGLEEHELAPVWHKVGRLVHRYGENFYNFEGLRKYKEKFEPEWRARYLAAPGGLSMAGALLDVTALISGGVARALIK